MKGRTSLLIFLVVLLEFTSSHPTSSNGEKRLIKTSEQDPGTWLTQNEIFSLKEQGINFMDITDRVFPTINKKHSTKALPSTLRFEATVKDLLSRLSIPRMTKFVTEYTTFNNRYYEAASGVEAAEWLLAEVGQSIENSVYEGTASVSAFPHSWSQPSVIARIEGSDSTLKSEVIVLGAHLDSLALGGSPATATAPGADDNASGSSVLLETLRVLLESNFIPKRTIEFQWYAAEEVGLRGSADIAQTYFRDDVNVVSMVNLDVVGYYVQGRNTIAIVTDYTDASLSQFLRTLIDGYLEFTWSNRACNYACSDHASWNSFGFAAACPIEVVFHPDMHTIRDTVDNISFTQILEFAKLAVGYAVEMGEPNTV